MQRWPLTWTIGQINGGRCHQWQLVMMVVPVCISYTSWHEWEHGGAGPLMCRLWALQKLATVWLLGEQKAVVGGRSLFWSWMALLMFFHFLPFPKGDVMKRLHSLIPRKNISIMLRRNWAPFISKTNFQATATLINGDQWTLLSYLLVLEGISTPVASLTC